MDSKNLSLRELTEQLSIRDEKIIEDEKTFRAIFYINPIPLVITTFEEGRYIMVNEAFCKTSGYKEKEAVGKTSVELNIYYEHSDRIKKIVGPIKREGFTKNIPITFRKKSGDLINTLVSTTIISIDNVSHYLSSIFDITANIELENKLKAEEEKYKSLVDGLRCVIYSVDLSGKFTYISKYGEELTGYKISDVLGTNFLDYIVEDDRDLVMKENKKMLDGEETNTSYRIIKANGEIIRIQSKSRLQNNEISGIFEVNYGRRSSDR